MPYIAIILFFLLLKIRNSQGPTAPVSSFLNEAYKWLAKKEGGLTDKELSATHSPCPYVKNGVTIYPNSSAGIKYDTYLNLAPAIGYTPNCENFIAMSSDTPNNKTWRSIVNWHFAKGLAFSNNPVIAAYLGLWYWGGWSQSVVSAQDVRDAIADSPNLDTQLANLVALRKYYFSKLNHSPALILAWQTRAQNFYDTFNKYV